MKIPVLAYQPMCIAGSDYRSNHLRALAEDLRRIDAAGFKVMALRAIVDAWLDNRGHELDGRIVALTCINGADFVFRDQPHPKAGPQRGVLGILRDFQAANPASQPHLNVTTFEVVSREAREALDAACMVGRGWWSDTWWREAAATGLIHVANHSWDHNHEALPPEWIRSGRPGTFASIDSADLAAHEIAQAAQELRRLAPNPGDALFAYPYGQSNAYLTQHYLPRSGPEAGIKAAFTACPGFLEPGTGRWEVPRFVFGVDWTCPAELDAILEAAADPARTWTAVRRMPVREPASDAKAPAARGARGLRDFIATRVEAIPGWLHPEAALLTAHLAQAQRDLGIGGPTLEIGVYHGKYLSLLYELSRPGERVVGVDLFVGSGDTERDVARVAANIAAACGESERLSIVVADSLQLDSSKLLPVLREAARFVSIDGGHTHEVVQRDLETAVPLLKPGGIMALDDAFNFSTPGVIEGIARWFERNPGKLAPFAICFNKLFVTTPDDHARYLAQALDFLEGADWLPTHEVSLARRRDNAQGGFTPRLFGYEVIPFL